MQVTRPHRPTGGFTLIEVIVVIAIMAIVVSGATFGINALTRSRLRSASMRVMSAAQYAYNRSVTHGTTTRLQFDFEKDTILFYEMMRSFLDTGGSQSALDEIIAEEKSHVAKLSALRG